MEVAIEVDLREQFGPVRDQGARPTCIAFAASDAHAAARPDWVPLSCEYAYFHALKRDSGQPHEGATADGMLGAIREDGQPTETHWPYLDALPNNLVEWNPPTKVTPLFRRGSAYGARGVSEIIARLDAGVPVFVTMCLSDAFFRPGNGGVIDADERPDAHRRHAVIAVGHGLRGKERMVLIRNSWGEAWGVGGYAWISEPYLANKVNVTAEMTKDLTNVHSDTTTADVRSSVA